jgi:hypothetical protein
VGFVTREQSVAEIIEELVGQALGVLAARCGRAPDQTVRPVADLSRRQDAPG